MRDSVIFTRISLIDSLRVGEVPIVIRDIDNEGILA